MTRVRNEAGMTLISVMVAVAVLLVAVLVFLAIFTQGAIFEKNQASTGSYREVEEGLQGVLSQYVKTRLTPSNPCAASSPPFTAAIGTTGLAMHYPAALPSPSATGGAFVNALNRCRQGSRSGPTEYYFCAPFSNGNLANSQTFARAHNAFAEIDVRFINAITGGPASCAFYAKSHPQPPAPPQGAFVAEVFYGIYWSNGSPSGEVYHATTGVTYVPP